MKSIWMDNRREEHHKKLNSNIKTDVLIIGGGMAGILCAHFLKEKGIDYTLVEAKRIGNGITQNTTAKITSQHGLIYDNLIKGIGLRKSKQYLQINQYAIKKYKELSQSISCDFEEKSAYVYSISNIDKIKREVEAVNSLGLKAEFTSSIPLPINIKGAIKFNSQGQFNPLKLIDGISRNLNIYEGTFVKEIKGNIAITNLGRITAKNIIITTHFPFINTHGSYFLKMYQHRSYFIALENAQAINGMYLEEKEKGMSFRNYKDLLLIGGGDHRTGYQGGSFEELRRFAKQKYPNASEKYYWATQDCMTLDGIPYIGRYSNSTPNLYVATGFNKWGMTSSMVSAIILSDLLTGKENEYSKVFSPSRSILKKQLIINGYEAVKNLVTISNKRCSHMGCALKWNKLQHTWDCPCHGSRFDKHGNLIDNPAIKEAKIN